MLFYHIKLRCYVVVELKAVSFETEFAGKLNFYVNAVQEVISKRSIMLRQEVSGIPKREKRI